MNMQLNTQTTLEFKPKTQTEMILEYLLQGNKISTWIAFTKFRCTCLAQRIYDIRKSEWYNSGNCKLKLKEETVKNNGKHYKEYWIERA